MAEWTKAVDSKSTVRVTVPGVQIPLSPPEKQGLGDRDQGPAGTKNFFN